MKWLAGIFIEKLLGAIWKAVSEYLEEQRHKKEVKKKVDEIMKEEPDAQRRAQRISDMLNRG